MTPEAFLRTIAETRTTTVRGWSTPIGSRNAATHWANSFGCSCELARAVGESESQNLKSLRQREDELLRAHRLEWLGGLARSLHDDSFAPCFGRGFIERVKVDADILVGNHELIGDLCPLLRSMTLFRAAEFWEGLAICPCCRLGNLEIADWLEYDQALVLANSRHVVDLKSISVVGSRLCAIA